MADNIVLTRYKADNSNFNKQTKDAQRALEQFGLKGTEVGNKLSSLTNILNINVGSLSKLSIGLGAIAGACKVAGDAFKQNEVLMDNWNGTVSSAKGVYEGFLNSLNTGDFSRFFNNIDNIVRAARAAYDALDDLETFNAFDQINMEEYHAKLTESITGFRNGKIDKAQLQSAADDLKKELGTRMEFETNAYKQAIDELAQKKGVATLDLEAALSGSYGNYEYLKKLGLSGSKRMPYGNVSGVASFGPTQYKDVAVAANEQERLGEMLRKLPDDELKRIQALGAQARRTNREILDIDKQLLRYTNGGSGGGGGTSKNDPAIEGTIRFYEDMIKELNTKVSNEVDAGVRDQLNNTIRIAKAEIEKLKTGTDLFSSIGTSPVSVSGIDMSNLQIDTKGLEYATQYWSDYAEGVKTAYEANMKAISSIGAVGAALQSIDDPAAKVIGIVAESIANIALTFSKSLAGTVTPWDWIAGAAAGTATMISTISAIKSATHFANGGIVPNGIPGGNTDNAIVAVSSGELILNKAQQSALASQLQQGQGNGRKEVEFRISGQELVGILRQEANINSYR